MIGDLLGGFLDYDKPLFSKGIVRIFIRHDLSKPILLKRVLMFDPRAEPMLTFAYKHLVGHCKFCGLITHVGHAMSSSPMASNKSILVHLPGFGSFAFVPGSSLAFSSQIPRGLARGGTRVQILGTFLFQHVAPCPLPAMQRHAVIIQNMEEKSPVDPKREVVVLGKYPWVLGESSSPKKLKSALDICCSSLEASALGCNASVGSGEAEDLIVAL
ncbi:hypothetical protein M0R45_000511 [Rubus argutus]|uniref:Uncharacterized protein n=1 Tax=Rubus argutus TaxID=59490 RepID=A0AAW1VND7_RUBAR